MPRPRRAPGRRGVRRRLAVALGEREEQVLERRTVCGASSRIERAGLDQRERQLADGGLVGGEGIPPCSRAAASVDPGLGRADAPARGRRRWCAGGRRCPRRGAGRRACPRRRCARVRTIATRLQSSSTSASRWLESSTVMPVVGEPADQQPHVAHARGVEPGRGLVEQQQLRAGAAARRRCPGAGACRASSRRPCPWRGRRSSTMSSDLVDPPAGVVAVERGAAARGCGGRSGRGRSAAPRRSRRRPRARATPACGSRPNSRTLPAVGRIRPSIIRSDVVLPAPLGPR